MSEDVFTDTQITTLKVTQSLTSVISVVSSLWIMYLILKKSNDRLSHPYNRIMLALSIADFCMSFSWMFGNLPSPEYQGFWGNLGGKGTTATCTLQGFFLALGSLASLLMSCTLMVYFSATVYHGISPKQFAARWELGLYVVSYVIPLVAVGLIARFKAFNWNGFSCIINNYPAGCERFGVPCERGVGDKIDVIWWTVWIAPVVFAFVVFKFAVIQVYWKVRTTARKSRGSAMTSVTAKIERQVATKCFLYALTFMNSYLWHLAGTILAIKGTLTGNFPMAFLWFLFAPLQGFFNLLIYIRERYIEFRTTQGRFRSFGLALTEMEGSTGTTFFADQ